MKTTLIKLLYYLGHTVYLLGMKYWYIPGSYSMYSYLMSKSAHLDDEGLVWGKPLAGPEKDEI